MKRGRWTCQAVGLALAGLTLIAAGCRATQSVRESVPFTIDDWKFGKTTGREIRTEHYVIYTTLTDPVLLEALPQFVEGCYEHYRALIPPSHEPTQLMPVYLFATRPQWEFFTRRFTGERASTFLKVRNGGYSERGTSVIQYVANSITFPLFAHEGFHQYLHHHVSQQVPAWLNEGLAVECEGQRWGAKGLKEFDPWYNPVRRNALSQALTVGKLHPLRTLIRTHAGEIVSGSMRSVATYYAQVWGLVLFLREGAGGRYRAGFEELLRSLDDPDFEQKLRVAALESSEPGMNMGEAMFVRFVGRDIDAIEAEYLAFLRQSFLDN